VHVQPVGLAEHISFKNNELIKMEKFYEMTFQKVKMKRKL